MEAAKVETAAETATLVLERTYEATPQALFNAWTQAQALERWFAPTDEMSTRVLELDLREGGRYRIQMIEADGAINTVTGTFQVVNSPNQLIFSWGWEARPGETPLDYSRSHVIVDIEAVDGGAKLRLTHAQLPNEEMRSEHEGGWNGCLDRLAHHLSG